MRPRVPRPRRPRASDDDRTDASSRFFRSRRIDMCPHPSSEAPPRRPSRTPRRVHPPRRRARAVLFIHVFIRVVLVHARRQAAVAPRDPTRLAPSRRARRLNLFSRGWPPRRSLAGRLRHARGARGVGPARDARLPRRARARPLAPRAPDRADAPRAPERRRVVVVVRSSSPSTSSLSRVDDDSPRARVGGDDERTQKQLAEDARLEPVRPAPGARPGVERPTDGSGRASRALQARSVRSPYYAGTRATASARFTPFLEDGLFPACVAFVSLRPQSLGGFNPDAPRCLSTPSTDAFQRHPSRRRFARTLDPQVRSIHWFPYDRAGVVNAVP